MVLTMKIPNLQQKNGAINSKSNSNYSNDEPIKF